MPFSNTTSLRFPFPVVALLVSLLAVLASGQNAMAAPHPTASKGAPSKPKRWLMAHYLPWFASKEWSGQWGWHWTMNHYDPNRFVGTPLHRESASHFSPMMGLYDSGDPDALRCQVMLMKLAGIDGIIIDWYGNADFNDYALINRNTLRLIPLLQQAGLRFAICFEDQSVAQEIAGGQFPASEAVAHGQSLMKWMDANFFTHPAYLRIEGRPILLSFGEPFYKDREWNDLFSVLPTKPLYFTEGVLRAATAATGCFGWPMPHEGNQGDLREQNSFYNLSGNWPHFIGVAYPRFQDIYAQAGVQPSWGTIADRQGLTYTNTLTRALRSNASIVQLATWNDWGEGTQIEPSFEFGFRDLEATQKLRQQYLDPRFAYAASHLRLPIEWYQMKKHAANKGARDALEAFFPLLISGHTKEARSLLFRYRQASKDQPN